MFQPVQFEHPGGESGAESPCQVRTAFAPVETCAGEETPLRPGAIDIDTEIPQERITRFCQSMVTA